MNDLVGDDGIVEKHLTHLGYGMGAEQRCFEAEMHDGIGQRRRVCRICMREQDHMDRGCHSVTLLTNRPSKRQCITL